MLSIIERAALRAKRAVQRREPRSLTEVTLIVRVTPTTWIATVEYTYGRNTWEEKVHFLRARGRDMDGITITDPDYPTDRTRHIIVKRGADMASVITEFLIAGRW